MAEPQELVGGRPKRTIQRDISPVATNVVYLNNMNDVDRLYVQGRTYLEEEEDVTHVLNGYTAHDN